MVDLIVYDIVRFEGKLYKTRGDYDKFGYSSYQRNISTRISIEVSPFIAQTYPIESIDKNLTQELKIKKVKLFIDKKVRKIRLRKLLKEYIMHWACKPGGPIYKLSYQRYLTNFKR